MPLDRFLIAPLNTGLQTDLKPWLISDDAFESLFNAYTFRGRVRKRFGGRLMGTSNSSATAPLSSRLRITVGTTDPITGNLSATVPGVIFKVGQQFSIGSEMFTVVNPAAGPQIMLDTGTTTTKTFDISNGNFVFVGAPLATAVLFYPSDPVMGLTVYESGPINNQPSYGFDTQFAYKFNGANWDRSGTGVNPIFHGTNSDFFWTENWRGAAVNNVTMFVTNFFANPNGAAGTTDDPIWFTQDGSTWTPATGNNAFYFFPNNNPPHTAPFIAQARLIIAFKDRLLLLNTIEQDGAGINTQFPQRARFSANASPFATNAWYEPNQQDDAGLASSKAIGGGFLDAPTEEQIVSAAFIKDRLIVYFERSTWELAYTGNQILPFVWQKLNSELGADATFSAVPFDKIILSIANIGIHACNGSNVERIDNKIPDEIFTIKNENQGAKRVAGIRDFFVEQVYWAYPRYGEQTTQVFPNQVLVYNYRTSSWAINDDCITAFGFFEQGVDVTWSSTTETWEQYNAEWNSGFQQAQARQILAGNPEGFVWIVDPEMDTNATVLQLTNIVDNGDGTFNLTIIDHTLDNDYIYITNANGMTNVTGKIFLAQFIDTNTVKIRPQDDAPISGTYTGGGWIMRISQIYILTKQFSPYVDKDQRLHLERIDYLVQKTQAGEIQTDYYPSASQLSMVTAGTQTGAIMGNSILETFPYTDLEIEEDRIWHPVYYQTTGNFVQVLLAMNDLELRTPAIAWSAFELEAMILYTQRAGSRMF
jgi:hypothetical protein